MIETIGLTKRLLVIVYDALLLIAVLILSLFVFVFVPQELKTHIIVQSIAGVYMFFIAFIFYGWFWTHGGQTLGMKTWHLYLIDKDGKFIDWPTAFKRYCCAILSWLFLGLGFTWILLNRNKLTWHDSLTRTRIVKQKGAKQKTEPG